MVLTPEPTCQAYSRREEVSFSPRFRNSDKNKSLCLPLTSTLLFFFPCLLSYLIFLYLLPISYPRIFSIQKIYISFSVIGVRSFPRDSFQAKNEISKDQQPQHRCRIYERDWRAAKKRKAIKCLSLHWWSYWWSPFPCTSGFGTVFLFLR